MNNFSYIVNTRSEDQSIRTHNAFEQYGYSVIDLPCIDIVVNDDSECVIHQMQHIDVDDIVIFTSQYAVRFAYRINPHWQLNHNNTVIAVGHKTAAVLEQNFSGDIWIPSEQNSQGVINLLKGFARCATIHIISAPNGRQLIKEYAIKEGKEYRQINVYKRQLPTVVNQKSLQALTEIESFGVIATSVSIIQNLKMILSEKLWQKVLCHTLICASKRIESAALALGFTKTINVDTANPDSMAEKISK